VLCIQHISPGFLSGLVDWLSAQCRVKIQVAHPGEVALPGRVYFPAEDTHLEVDRQGRLQESREPPVEGHRPSVTVTFRSLARSYREAAIGVLLSGMGRDGSEGMLAVAQAGGFTIAQDEASCVIFGMPKQAIELGAARSVLPPAAIAATLIEVVLRTSKGA
jgi:two-component system chemotaxis response regulator CheB